MQPIPLNSLLSTLTQSSVVLIISSPPPLFTEAFTHRFYAEYIHFYVCCTCCGDSVHPPPALCSVQSYKHASHVHAESMLRHSTEILVDGFTKDIIAAVSIFFLSFDHQHCLQKQVKTALWCRALSMLLASSTLKRCFCSLLVIHAIKREIRSQNY